MERLLSSAELTDTSAQATVPSVRRYGYDFPTDDPVAVELMAIRAGGRWLDKRKRECGAGLFEHHKALQSMIAPWKRWDRWSELLLREFIANRMTVVVGPANSTKTHNASFYALDCYLADPERTTVLMSSTDSRSLEMRIWGEFKKLWSSARALSDSVTGRLIESRQMVVTDTDAEATDFRNGAVGIPTVYGGSFVGLGKFVGIKNTNVIVVADELSFMSIAFFDSVANLAKNKGFHGIGLGNPKDRTDTLGRLAEPSSEVGGWEGVEDTGKTRSWPTRFAGGKCVCLDGRDTPNNDPPGNQWPYIIRASDVASDIALYGQDSIQVSMMDYGVFPKDAQARRVLTRTLCEQAHALEEVTWEMPPQRIAGLDAAYGSTGGDRCVLAEGAWGRCTDGIVRVAFTGSPVVVPVKAGLDVTPEDQIADYVKRYCEERDIPPSHFGLDSTGRGTLVKSLCTMWSTDVVPVEFGGAATERPVSDKIETTCRRYYANFMSELWYQFREAVRAGQVRQLPTDAMDEMCLRGWEPTRGNRIQVEPKDEMKLRSGRSPDIGDAAVVLLEVARRLGFTIGGGSRSDAKRPRWLDQDLERVRKLKRTYALTATAGRT